MATTNNKRASDYPNSKQMLNLSRDDGVVIADIEDIAGLAAVMYLTGGGIGGSTGGGFNDAACCLSFHLVTRWYKPLALQLAFFDANATLTGTLYSVACSPVWVEEELNLINIE